MNKESKATIVSETLLDRLPSGSGIALWKDSLYIVSDDAPFVYQLSLKDNSYRQYALIGYARVKYRIPKPVKPDFESATIGTMNGREYIFAFGSGSKSPGRDSLLICNLLDLNNQRIINLTPFYKYLQEKTATPAKQWNIEGVAITDDTMLLFNRGNNLVVEIPWKEFMGYLGPQNPLPSITHYKLNLPRHNGHLSRISGTCELNKEGDILFCASIEDTPNWYSDGPVLGSYVGIFDRRTKSITKADLLTDASGEVLTNKLESIELLRIDNDGKIHVIAVADNDDGNTKLFHIILGGERRG